jgi:hypothetical protein
MDLSTLIEQVQHLTGLVNSFLQHQGGSAQLPTKTAKKRTSDDSPLEHLVKGFLGKKNTQPRHSLTNCSLCDGALGTYASLNCCPKSIRMCTACVPGLMVSLQEL